MLDVEGHHGNPTFGIFDFCSTFEIKTMHAASSCWDCNFVSLGKDECLRRRRGSQFSGREEQQRDFVAWRRVSWRDEGTCCSQAVEWRQQDNAEGKGSEESKYTVWREAMSARMTAAKSKQKSLVIFPVVLQFIREIIIKGLCLIYVSYLLQICAQHFEVLSLSHYLFKLMLQCWVDQSRQQNQQRIHRLSHVVTWDCSPS